MHKLGFIAVLVALGVFAAGCDSKVSQCNSLNKVINKGSEQLKKSMGSANQGDPKAIKDIAGQIKSLADEVGKVSLKDSKLKDFQKNYKELLEKFAKIFVDRAEAMDKKDTASVIEGQKRLVEVITTENEIIADINGYCSGGGGKGKGKKKHHGGKKKKH